MSSTLPPPGAIRVLLVDDSAIVRGLMSRWVEAEPGVCVAGVAVNGREAVKQAAALKPDVIVMDVEMPELDGLGALPEILKVAPDTKILMSSAVTRRNAEISLRALANGAADYLPKPEAGRISGAADFKRDLIGRIRALAGKRRVSAAAPDQRHAAASPAKPIALRPAPRINPEIIVIGSSTGGPQALHKVIAAIGARVRTPILIVQHMPAMFTTILAEHLSKVTSAPVMEARDGMPLRGGSVYVAPGDFHMRVARRNGAVVIALDQTPPVNFCRPAVDPLFNSASELYGANVLALVLTGMGADGKKGAEAIVAKGGAVVAQDEATSVVWGMPGAVASAGLACAVRPLDDIGSTLLSISQGRAL